MYIAHIREKDMRIQSVKSHLEEVQLLCERFGEKIGVKHLAGLSGMLHDVGKNTNAFKSYIWEAVTNPDNPPQKGSVDHSTAGGKLLYDRYYANSMNADMRLTVEWVAMCVLSHHSGLLDYLTPEQTSDFLRRVFEKNIDEYEHAVSVFFSEQIHSDEFDLYFQQAVNETTDVLMTIKNHQLRPISASLLIKYLFSCLIDADRLNARAFEEDEPPELAWDVTLFFQKCYDKLMDKIKAFEAAEDAHHPINSLRSQMSAQCEQFAHRASGIYTLSIPTGGGKTLASLRYALKHALLHGKERIIYIVPYTTIIEQNAREVRNILEGKGTPEYSSHILEHHSNIIDDLLDQDADEQYILQRKKVQLARDNWDTPILFTTMVQFLNAFYARGTRNVRRLHRLANAVIIFDEVQSVPVHCAALFNEALNFLHTFGRSSIVLCTATQPALGYIQNQLKLSPDGEIIEDLPKVYHGFKRVNVVNCTTPDGYCASDLKDLIVRKMDEVDSVLIILNTKSAVKKLFKELNQVKDEHKYRLFHLSTNMCAAHRQDVIDELRAALERRERVVCVSTQLIEAGVDISFQCVFRSLAGLDSIAQAAGRCNRHGKDGIREVYIIHAADESLSKLKTIAIGAEQTKRILKEFEHDPSQFDHDLLSPKAMNIYFKYYFKQIEYELQYPIQELDKTMVDLLDKNSDLYSAYFNKHGKPFPLYSRQSFATAEKHFRVIDEHTTSVLVPYDDKAKELILDLNGEPNIEQLSLLLRKAQRYVVNVYSHEWKELEKNGDLDVLLHGNVYAVKETAYNKRFGLDLEGESEWSFAWVD